MRPERVTGEAGFEKVAPLTRIARMTRNVAYAALFLLILLAFVAAFLRSWREAWAIVGFVVLGLGIVAGVAFNFEAVADVVISRKTAIGANSVLMVALAFALLAMVNYLSARHFARADLTSARRFTLDDRTKKLLARLEDDLHVATVMVPPRFGGADLSMPVRSLLEQYEVESERVKVTHTDPLADKLEVLRVADKMGFPQDAVEGDCILLAYGDNTKKLRRSDLVQEEPFNPYSGRQRPPPKFRLEDAMTSAIRELIEQQKQVLYHVVGHGERPMGPGRQQGVGFSLAKADLRSQNYDIRELRLAERNAVPEDASVVLIAGPVRTFSSAEVEALKKYLDGGGGAVVLLDSTLGARGMMPSGLDGILEERGIRVRQDVEVKHAVRVLGMIAFSKTIQAAWYSASHPVTGPLNEAQIGSHFYKPCLLEKTEAGDPSLLVEELVKAVQEAWGETSASGQASQRPEFEEGGDVRGPIVLAMASGPEEGEEGGKLVVFADVDFASDVMYPEMANGDLFVNAISWIVGVKENIGIKSRDPDIRTANMTDKNRNRVFLVDIVLVPVLVLVCGGIVLWLRRK